MCYRGYVKDCNAVQQIWDSIPCLDWPHPAHSGQQARWPTGIYCIHSGLYQYLNFKVLHLQTNDYCLKWAGMEESLYYLVTKRTKELLIIVLRLIPFCASNYFIQTSNDFVHV